MVVLRTGGLVSASHICDNETWHHNQKSRNLTFYVIFTERFCFMGEALEVAFHAPPVGRHPRKMIHSLEETCGQALWHKEMTVQRPDGNDDIIRIQTDECSDGSRAESWGHSNLSWIQPPTHVTTPLLFL